MHHFFCIYVLNAIDLQLLLKATARYFAPETVSCNAFAVKCLTFKCLEEDLHPKSRLCGTGHSRYIGTGKLSHDHPKGKFHVTSQLNSTISAICCFYSAGDI